MASNKRALKAFVRYDGTGRVIPGSLILQRFQPKVGNWTEIPAYECCNYLPGCVRFTVSASADNDYFSILFEVANDAGLPVTATITWGDGVVESVTVNAGQSLGPFHYYSIGQYDGYICFDAPERIISLIINRAD